MRNRLLGYPRIDVDEKATRVSSKLLAEANDQAGGNAVGSNNTYIAAIAQIFDDAVLTDNVDYFEKLNVPVETY